ncbi:membrane peptidoglycan carboxypeptidase [Glaciihabitans tibetensis]|uniref:Membrane peptidoglycan carboxypeptidase n=1 Tax=Glaciihabitans tibetensis TaxID=1266600 RepID=A0A2T0V5E5_9MICO|nr:transglycosylase domain-containing protein [Glaciihabitans tibetensis]PRY65374.1 membrane peptidoglycan carboxypeptidase [Glaciihabitans tibetensis]
MSALKPRPGSVLAALLGTLGFSALAGVLVAVMVTPAIAVAGATVNNTIGIFDSLPEYIEIDQQAQQNRIYATQAGAPVQIATIFDQNREEVTWEEVSDFAKNAAVSGEDRRFYEHGGVDIPGVVRAAITNVAGGGISEGASTITQQYVKNTFIQQALELPTEEEQDAAYEAAIDDTFDRKLKEMKLAISLEKEYTKQEILLAYLNIANFGGNTYGIEAAAERYYNTTALNLTVAQAASLIATVQSPGVLRLDHEENWPGNLERRDVIIEAMLAEGNITQAQRDEAIATPIDATTVVITEPSNGCMAANDHARYFCDYISNLVKDLPALGADPTERAANFKHGGYDIYTTLDLDLQNVAQEAEWKLVPSDATTLNLGSATVSVEVGTGRILTMAQNKVYNNTQAGGGITATAVNFSTDRAYGGSSGFQPGSTYKVFTLLNWLQNGHGLNERVNGSARTVAQSAFTTCDGPYSGPYQFKNDDGSGGNMTVATATQKSVNGAFISMALELDLCEIRDTAASIGVHRADGAELEANPSSVLGTNTISPLTMATAYASIASGGTYCKSVAIDRIVAADGAELPGQSADCAKALESDVANTAAFAMSKVMIGGGTATRANPDNGVEYIGKTGTTDSSNQTWVVGASTKVATAVWVGNISGTYAMRKYYTPARVQGSVLRHDVFRAVATAADKNPALRGADEFPEASKALLTGTGITIPEISGQTVEAATSVLEGNGFTVTNGGAEASSIPAGRAVRTSPPTGSLVSKGGEVTLFSSDGSLGSVPSVLGTAAASARTALTDAGFTSIGTDQCSVIDAALTPEEKTALRDTVSAVNPGVGTEIAKTDTVTLTVNKEQC